MSEVSQLHPEALLDRHHDGSLDEGERERLTAHAAQCEACRLELMLMDDLAAEEADAAPPALDHLVLGAVPGARPSSRLPSTRWLWVLAAVVIAGTATAAYVGARAGGPPPSNTSSAPVSVAPTVENDHSDGVGRASAGEAEAKEAESSKHRELPPRPEPSSSTAPPSAASLFSAGNAARRAGEARRALALYHQLQRLYPGSREARLSRAMTAKLMAETQPEKAVDGFDAYLDEGGRLDEEALVGRADALAKLGRRDEEAATWHRLLAEHPRSIHAARARQRLAILRENADEAATGD